MVSLSSLALLIASPLLLAQASALANSNGPSFRLRADVATICTIVEVKVISSQQNEIVVRTHCNAQRFAIVFYNELSDEIIVGATVASGRLVRTGERLEVISTQPGWNEVRIHFAQLPDHLAGQSIMLEIL